MMSTYPHTERVRSISSSNYNHELSMLFRFFFFGLNAMFAFICRLMCINLYIAFVILEFKRVLCFEALLTWVVYYVPYCSLLPLP